MKRWAVALLATVNGVGSAEIFSRAAASPSGYLVKSAPEASAKNSLFLEIASLIKIAIIGAKIAKTKAIIIKIAFDELFSSLSPPPPHQVILINQSARRATDPTRIETIVISLVS